MEQLLLEPGVNEKTGYLLSHIFRDFASETTSKTLCQSCGKLLSGRRGLTLGHRKTVAS